MVGGWLLAQRAPTAGPSHPMKPPPSPRPRAGSDKPHLLLHEQQRPLHHRVREPADPQQHEQQPDPGDDVRRVCLYAAQQHARPQQQRREHGQRELAGQHARLREDQRRDRGQAHAPVGHGGGHAHRPDDGGLPEPRELGPEGARGEVAHLVGVGVGMVGVGVVVVVEGWW